MLKSRRPPIQFSFVESTDCFCTFSALQSWLSLTVALSRLLPLPVSVAIRLITKPWTWRRQVTCATTIYLPSGYRHGSSKVIGQNPLTKMLLLLGAQFMTIPISLNFTGPRGITRTCIDSIPMRDGRLGKRMYVIVLSCKTSYLPEVFYLPVGNRSQD